MMRAAALALIVALFASPAARPAEPARAAEAPRAAEAAVAKAGESPDADPAAEDKGRKGSRQSFDLSLGPEWMSVSESGFEGYRAWQFQLRAAYRRALGGRFSLAAEAAFSGLPVSRSLDTHSAQSLSAEADLGYTVLSRKSWKLDVLGGLHFRTMLVTGDYFGYGSQMSPRLFPYATFRLNDRQKLGAYAKFSPVFDGFGLLPLSGRNLCGGLVLTHRLGSGRTILGTVEFTETRLDLLDAGIVHRSITVLGGVRF